MTPEQLKNLATEFTLDDFLAPRIKKTNNNKWVIMNDLGSQLCSDYQWKHRPYAYDQYVENLKYEFDSVQEALDLYLEHRKQTYFVFCKFPKEKRWCCFEETKIEQFALKVFEETKRTRTGTVVLVGLNDKILEKFVSSPEHDCELPNLEN